MEEQLGTKRESLIAVLGPSIRQECFETDADVPEAMEELLGAQVHPFIMENEKWFVIGFIAVSTVIMTLLGQPATPSGSGRFRKRTDSSDYTACHSSGKPQERYRR